MSIENNENKEAATTETTTPKAPKKSGSIKKSFQTDSLSRVPIVR